MNPARCDIIIPVFNRLELTRNCLKSIAENTSLEHNIILIDNSSEPETAKFLEDYKKVHGNVFLMKNSSNLGWVQAVNQGLKASVSPYICVMNNDTLVKTGSWLSKLIEVLESTPDIGLVNPYFKAKRRISSEAPYVEIDFCRGYCVVMKRMVMEKIGLLDEAYGFGYYDDDDYSIRTLKAGFRCVRANKVFVEHLGDTTFSDVFQEDTRYELHAKNKRLFYSRWGKRLRIVFIITRYADRKAIVDLLFSLARSQHIIYLWNLATPFSLQHINIRERIFPASSPKFLFPLFLLFNQLKKEEKQYDLVFTDDQELNSTLSKMRHNVYPIDIARDMGRVMELANSTSRT